MFDIYWLFFFIWYADSSSTSLNSVTGLQSIFNSTNGVNWNWADATGAYWNFSDVDPDPCADNWEGISCTCSSVCEVSSIQLPEFGLQGQLPDSFDLLSLLSIFDVGYNLVNGTLPNSLFNILSLNQLSINSNNIRSTIPTGVGSLSALIYLDLSENFLTGDIPSSLGAATLLTHLLLSHNILKGTLPSNLGNLLNLVTFSANFNRIGGVIPRSFGDLVSLKSLLLSQNCLEGSVPTSFGKLNGMVSVLLSFNQLEGTLPTLFGAMHDLEYLVLSRNAFSGTIPSEYGLLTKLQALHLFDNSISGTIPSFIGTFTNLYLLLISSNVLVGTLPSNIGNLQNLHSFECNKNRLSGTIPDSFFSISNLQVLIVAKNHFRGTVIGKINSNALQTVDLSSNSFTHELPFELFNSSRLITFVASKNCFSGSISSEICKASSLRILELSGLSTTSGCVRHSSAFSENIFYSKPLDGDFPSCLFQMPNLTLFYADGNGIRSELSEIRAKSSLRNMSLSNNRLFGTIPMSIQSFPNWLLLDLSHNQLSGTIYNMSLFSLPFSPSESYKVELLEGFDFKFVFVRELNLNINRLSGQLPESFERANFTMNILGGNLFDCQMFPHSNLPQNDPNYQKFSCGSTVLDINMYLYFVLLIFLLLILIALIRRVLLKGSFRSATKENTKSSEGVVSITAKYFLYGRVINNQENKLVYKLAVNFSKFRQFNYFLVVYIGLVCVPCYIALKLVNNGEYSMYTYQYAWIVSYGFLQGVAPVIVVTLLFVILLSLVYAIPNYLTIEVMFKEADKLLYSDWISFLKSFNGRRLLVLVDVIVVCGVNGVYVYVALTQSHATYIAAFICLLIFKLVWNVVIIAVLDSQGYTTMSLVFTAVFNTIFGPVIANLIVDPSCFQGLFIAPAAIDSFYFYTECSLFSTNSSSCLEKKAIPALNSFYPPFQYSYQCGSSLLQHYVPIYVSLYTVLGVVIPGLCFLLLIYFAPVADALTKPAIPPELEFRVKLWRSIKKNLVVWNYATGWVVCKMVLPLDLTEDLKENENVATHSITAQISRLSVGSRDSLSKRLSEYSKHRMSGSKKESLSEGHAKLEQAGALGSPEVQNPLQIIKSYGDRPSLSVGEGVNETSGSLSSDAVSMVNGTEPFHHEVPPPVDNAVMPESDISNDVSGITELNTRTNRTTTVRKTEVGGSRFSSVARKTGESLVSTRLSAWNRGSIGESRLTNIMETNENNRPLYDIKYWCLICSVAFILLLSFGIAYPPLAVMLAVQSTTTTLLLQSCIHCHYIQLVNARNPFALALWNRRVAMECQDVHELLFEYSIPFMMFSIFFTCLFIVDMDQGILASCLVGSILVVANAAAFIRKSKYTGKARSQSGDLELNSFVMSSYQHWMNTWVGGFSKSDIDGDEIVSNGGGKDKMESSEAIELTELRTLSTPEDLYII